MTAPRQRDEVFAVAPRDCAHAERLAARIDDPWFRAQALGAVARYAPEQRVADVAATAEQSTATDADDYVRCASLAWAIRALVERGFLTEAAHMLARATAKAAVVAHPGSAAAALEILLHAGWPLGVAQRRPVLHELALLERRTTHWRARRNLRDALALALLDDADHVSALAQSIEDPRTRRQTLDRLRTTTTGAPRDFYW